MRLEVGVERQRQDCVALATRLWPGTPVRAFVDNDVSAANPTIERPGWRALLDALRLGDIGQVVAYDQSRLTRQPIEWEQLLVVLARSDIVSVHTVRDGERSVGEGTGRMMTRILAAVDAEAVETTRLRVKRAMRQLAAEGRPNGGPIFGYRSIVGPDGRKTREVVREEAEAIRWAADHLLSGNTLASAAREFEARHLRHKKAGLIWHPTTVRSLMTMPGIAGLRPDPQRHLIRAIWPPILDVETWRRVRATLSRPAVLVRSDGLRYRTTRVRRPSRRHLLSAGIASCGVCGAPLAAQMRKRPDGSDFVSYLCDPRLGQVCVGIVGHYLERCVVEALLAAMVRPEVALLLRPPDTAESRDVTGAIEQAESDLADLAASWGRGEISRGEWNAARPAIQDRLSLLRGALGHFAVASFGEPATLPARWPDLGLVARRAIIAAVFERISVHRATRRTYDPDRIELVYRSVGSARG